MYYRRSPTSAFIPRDYLAVILILGGKTGDLSINLIGPIDLPDTPFLVRCTTCLMYNSFHGLVTIIFCQKHWIGDFVFGSSCDTYTLLPNFLPFVMFNTKIWRNGTLAEYASRLLILTSVAVYISPFWQSITPKVVCVKWIKP